LPYLLFSFWLIGLPVGDSTLHNISSSFQPVTTLTEVSFVEILPQVEDGILIIPLGSLIVLVISLFNVSLDLLTPLFVSTFSILTEPMALFKRRNMVQMAASKLRNLKDLKVIAITGSYGKTTTKELLFQILSNKFITAKTPENHNTDVGIAQAITNFVNEDTEIFIAEMGAYKKGEIMKSTKVAPPDISIVTGVEGQHLSIFGTIENVFEAKYEIIQGMKDDGLAILNGNNEYAVRMAERTDKEKIMYYSINEELDLMTATSEEDDEEEKVSFPKNANIYAKDIIFGKKGLEFTLVLKGTEYSIKTNIPGLHNASNLLAAIAVGLRLGIQPNELVEIINETNFDVPYLKTVVGINESKIIDDGYNVSPTGFLSGLLMLSKQTVKGKHWVLTQGLIELGTDREKVYKRLAKELVKKADGLITSDEDLHAGVLQADSSFNSILVDTPYKLKNAYIEHVHSGDLVLIEGSLPGVVLSAIKTTKDE
ncbi:UDP-N-acetylmuramoyl-tripeptide--D-alanyl-D-alanine ligase, partial [Candidatus Dojkabacteria bacterium]|nr:UDP-N-acetylmuramoyl-tripeptide--D-alanyl-D-alanine ligase [Candidatus Dojkabacteria bacterium]